MHILYAEIVICQGKSLSVLKKSETYHSELYSESSLYLPRIDAKRSDSNLDATCFIL